MYNKKRRKEIGKELYAILINALVAILCLPISNFGQESISAYEITGNALFLLYALHRAYHGLTHLPALFAALAMPNLPEDEE